MSIKFEPKINIDPHRIAMKIRKAAEESLPALGDQVLTDVSQYVPNRSGILESAGNNSYNVNKDKLNATIKWDTEYAPYVYKGISKRGKPLKYNKDPNAKAGAEWCKRAKDLHLSDWDSKLNDEMRKHLKNK